MTMKAIRSRRSLCQGNDDDGNGGGGLALRRAAETIMVAKAIKCMLGMAENCYTNGFSGTLEFY